VPQWSEIKALSFGENLGEARRNHLTLPSPKERVLEKSKKSEVKILSFGEGRVRRTHMPSHIT